MSFHGDAFKGVDVVAALDVVDWTRGSHKLNTQTREVSVVTAPDCKWIDVGFADIEISKWATDYNKHHNWDLRVLGDSALSLPALTAACRKRIDGNKSLTTRIAERKKAIGERHARQWQKWQDQVKEEWNERPMTESRLAHELWQVIKDDDWVLTANTLKEWVHKVWDFDKPYRHVGRELGTGTQIGMSIGVALAHKGSGKLVIDLQPDGDLMFDLGALWMPVKYRNPNARSSCTTTAPTTTTGRTRSIWRTNAAPIRRAPISAWTSKARRPISRISPKASAGTPKDPSKIPPKSARR